MSNKHVAYYQPKRDFAVLESPNRELVIKGSVQTVSNYIERNNIIARWKEEKPEINSGRTCF